MYDDDDDDFAPLGTAFAPLEADEIVSRKPDIDLTVRDERGRRRFHGAFTGGFSAGYWNTVGSAEGFTPKIFQSSRKNKYDHQSTRPEDFMDDEDFGSFGIAPKRIHTKDDFVENTTFAGMRDLTFDDVIKSVFQPAKESIGKRLFRKMKRNIQIDHHRTRDNNVLMLDEAKGEQPRQSPHETLQPKVDMHGLGYDGMLDPNNFLYGEGPNAKANQLESNSVSATIKGGRRIKFSGEAFGYGADEDDDYDAAVYSKDDMSQYDFAIGSVQKQAPKPKKVAVMHRDGTIELDGFAQCHQVISLFHDLRRLFRPPVVPRGWRPKRRTKSKEEMKKSRWDVQAANAQESDDTTKSTTTGNAQPKVHQLQPTMNANLRAVILGEEVVYKSGVAKTTNKPETEKSAPRDLAFDKVLHPGATEQKTPLSTAALPSRPLSGFFAAKFTRSSTSTDDVNISAGLSTFKDVSSMAGFENRAKPSEEDEADQNRPPSRTTYEWHPHKLLCKRFGQQNPYPLLTDIVDIVSLDGKKARNQTSTLQNISGPKSSGSRTLFGGLFGNLNEVSNFSAAVTPSNKSKNAAEPLDNAQNSTNASSGNKLTDKSNEFNKLTDNKIRNQSRLDSDDSDEEVVEERVPRPPIDLFKSIFASDEEDNDEDDDEENQAPSKTKQSQDKEDTPKGNDTKSNIDNATLNGDKGKKETSKSNGIFSGVDFDQLHQNFNPCLRKEVTPEPAKLEVAVVSDEDDDCFGPALPPPPQTTSNVSGRPTSIVAQPILPSSSNKTETEKNDQDHHRSEQKHHHRRKEHEHRSSSSRKHSKDKKKSKKSKTHKKDNSKKRSKSSKKKTRRKSSSKDNSDKDRKRKRHSSESENDSSSSDSSSASSSRIASPHTERGGNDGDQQHRANIESQLLELIKRARHAR